MSEIFNGAPESATTVGPIGTHQTTINPDNGKVVSTDGAARNINKSTISEKLSQINPARTPLDTFLRNIKAGTTKSDKYEFYSIIARGVKCTLASGGAITLDGVTTLTLSPGGIHHLSKDGDLLIPSYNVANGKAEKLNDGVASRPLVIHIVELNYVENTIKVVGVNGTATLDAETVMYRMASAKDQDAAISNDPLATPTKDFNFCQRNIVTVSENAFQSLQEKEVEYGLAEFKEQAFADFRYQAEVTSLFGASFAGVGGGEYFIDPITQKRKLHMRGLVDFNIQGVELNAQTDADASINAMMQQMFAVNNGSEERLLLYGAGFATLLSNSKQWVKQLEANKTDVAWGVRWKMFESNFGVLRAIYAPALSLCGYGNAAFIIDPYNLRRVDQIKLHERKLDLQTAGIRNSKDVMLEESWTLEATNPTTHGIVTFTA